MGWNWIIKLKEELDSGKVLLVHGHLYDSLHCKEGSSYRVYSYAINGFHWVVGNAYHEVPEELYLEEHVKYYLGDYKTYYEGLPSLVKLKLEIYGPRGL